MQELRPAELHKVHGGNASENINLIIEGARMIVIIPVAVVWGMGYYGFYMGAMYIYERLCGDLFN